MTDLVEDIACGAVEVLQKIRIAAGYANDVSSVERVIQKGNVAADRKIIVGSGIRRPPKPTDLVPLGHDGYRVGIDIILMVSESSETGISVDQRLSAFDSDVVQALRWSYDNGGPISKIVANQYFEDAPRSFLFNGMPAMLRMLDTLLITLLNQPNQQ